ncbi:MAG: hypothetical protein E7211_14605 [Clostridium lundense]|nr:hypothetical protein [Clostridium lundense]
MNIKYTRYDLKRKRKDNVIFFIILIMILILSFLIGSIFFKLFIKNSSIIKTQGKVTETKVNDKSINNKGETPKESIVSSNSFVYVAVQGGMFGNETGVEKTRSQLSSYGNPFVINDNKYKRVFLGIYTEDAAKVVINTLNTNKVSNSTMKFEIKVNNLCDMEISEILNGYIQVLGKLSEKNVKAIQTQDFKNWCKSLETVNQESPNIKILNELKDKVAKLPNELSNDKTAENYTFIYSILQKMK